MDPPWISGPWDWGVYPTDEGEPQVDETKELEVADVWTDRGSRWDGSTKTTKVRLQTVGGELWLTRKHCDGGWVTVRKATENDREWFRIAAK